jgi:hypothetical protein
VADLGGRGAVLQQQRNQDGGISRKCVQARVLLRSVEKYLAQGAIREAPDLHPKMMAGVLELDGDSPSAIGNMEGKHAGACAPCEVLDHAALERGLGLVAAGHFGTHFGPPAATRSRMTR